MLVRRHLRSLVRRASSTTPQKQLQLQPNGLVILMKLQEVQELSAQMLNGTCLNKFYHLYLVFANASKGCLKES